MATSRAQTTTDPMKALGRHITSLARRVRALELHPDPTSSGGDVPVYASRTRATSPNADLVVDPLSSTQFWLPLDFGGTPTADTGESSGWTYVDHRGTGRATMMVPPESGQYLFGMSIQAGFYNNSIFTTGHLKATAGAVLVHSGSPDYTELSFGDSKDVASYNPTSDFQLAFCATGFAPVALATNEIGFAFGISIDASPWTVNHVSASGWTPMAWAFKVG